ncbi:MAG: HEPN domain-containing protein [Dehalococcoidales bacterium]|nr:HEPN domain-containing protein [Dehalococcoidales bacterium]
MAKLSGSTIEPSSSRDYFIKAKEFYETMQRSYDEQLWNAVGLNAVHCAISASDALLAQVAGLRNTSQDHRLAADLLIEKVPYPQTKEYAGHLRKILGLKNVIEYERKLFTQKNAEEIVKHTERFYQWVKKSLDY